VLQKEETQCVEKRAMINEMMQNLADFNEDMEHVEEESDIELLQ